MPGNSSRAAPAPASSCPTARPVRSSRSKASGCSHTTTGKRRNDMNATSLSGLHAVESPRFPSLRVRGLAGSSFKHEHLAAILDEGKQRRFYEVHAENYMGAGGPPHRALEAIRRDHAVSLHGVCMSIGGPQPLDQAHLSRFRSLVERYEPALVSEHLAWSTHETTCFNDLLPLPYTQVTIELVCEHIDEVQNTISRP